MIRSDNLISLFLIDVEDLKNIEAVEILFSYNSVKYLYTYVFFMVIFVMLVQAIRGGAEKKKPPFQERKEGFCDLFDEERLDESPTQSH